jgi:hypothetical protein
MHASLCNRVVHERNDTGYLWDTLQVPPLQYIQQPKHPAPVQCIQSVVPNDGEDEEAFWERTRAARPRTASAPRNSGTVSLFSGSCASTLPSRATVLAFPASDMRKFRMSTKASRFIDLLSDDSPGVVRCATSACRLLCKVCSSFLLELIA